jgi:Aldo/keto reductase family
VRHIGVSNFDVEQLRRIGQIAPVETLQPQYSLIERDVEQEILPFADRALPSSHGTATPSMFAISKAAVASRPKRPATWSTAPGS